jgi:hypothetical protein
VKKLVGHLVEVEFLDHVLQGPGSKLKGVVRFKVWGRVQSISSEVIVVKTWELQGGTRSMKTHNNEIAKILMSTVQDIRFLKVVEEGKPEEH